MRYAKGKGMSNDTLITFLNALVADHLILVMKLHNYHWNVRGSRFHSIHLLTEKYYDYFFKSYDELAERILQLGGSPLVTVKGSLAAARVKEAEETSFTELQVLEAVREDFQFLRSTGLEAADLAAEAGDGITEGMLFGFVAWLEKELWMLRATLDASGVTPEGVAA